MPHIAYTGPFIDGVTVDLPNGRWIEFPHGEPVEVEEDLAKALLAQGNIWKAVKQPKKAPVDPEQENKPNLENE